MCMAKHNDPTNLPVHVIQSRLHATFSMQTIMWYKKENHSISKRYITTCLFYCKYAKLIWFWWKEGVHNPAKQLSSSIQTMPVQNMFYCVKGILHASSNKIKYQNVNSSYNQHSLPWTKARITVLQTPKKTILFCLKIKPNLLVPT